MSTKQTNSDGSLKSFVRRIGIPPALFWGFVGVLLFMVGDGVELGYLELYMKHGGFAGNQVATLLSIYGISVAIASWLSGALSERFSPHRVMTLGFLIWIVFEIPFLVFGLGDGNYPIMLVSYFLRGFGYPLFAYGFLVWISAATPDDQLGTAVGWFWFAFTGGLPTLAGIFAGAVIPMIGQYYTFWASLVMIIPGGLIALVGVREQTGRQPIAGEAENPIRDLFRGVTILWRDFRTGVGGVVRVINTTPEFGFFVFLPGFFTGMIGFSLQQWLLLQSTIYGTNIIFNLIFGVVGDRIGWRRTVTYFGGIGCAIATLALYYIPLWTGNYYLSLFAGMLYGALLAGFVPLSALMPSMVSDEDTGSSMAILNLGAGLATFVGPAIVRVFRPSINIVGVIWVFTILYVLSAILSFIFLRDANDPAETISKPAVMSAEDD